MSTHNRRIDPFYFAIFPRDNDAILYDGERILVAGETGSLRKLMHVFRDRNVFIRHPDGKTEFPDREGTPILLSEI